jgi:peptide/nickel transport system ATP-binding protein
MIRPTLEVHDLRTRFELHGSSIEVVRGVDLSVAPGEVLGLIGESGSGKTVTGLSILRLLPAHARVSSAMIRFNGKDLRALGEDDFQALRGRHLAMIFQNPLGAFNPAKRVGWHMREIVRRRLGNVTAWSTTACSALTDVGIPHPRHVLRLYPHQLSGGMAQRILIAMVLALEPGLIVADEPTTNLDNIVERQIIELFRSLQRRLNAAFVFITHDMSLAGTLCDRIAVMYAGEIVEIGPTRDLFVTPRHPYTQGLVATAMALQGQATRLKEIPGELPDLAAPPPGCLFAPRCASAMSRCTETAPPAYGTAPHFVRCYLADPS